VTTERVIDDRSPSPPLAIGPKGQLSRGNILGSREKGRHLEAELGTRTSLILGMRASRMPIIRTIRTTACVPSGGRHNVRVT